MVDRVHDAVESARDITDHKKFTFAASVAARGSRFDPAVFTDVESKFLGSPIYTAAILGYTELVMELLGQKRDITPYFRGCLAPGNRISRIMLLLRRIYSRISSTFLAA